MPNKVSAKKRMRQNVKRRERNRAVRGEFRTALKKAVVAVAPGSDAAAAETQVQATLKTIGKTQRKGFIHKNKAARHQSALMRKLNELKAAKDAASEG